MTKLKLATLAGLAALGVSAAGAASAQNITSMGYVDSLQWKINHAYDLGAIRAGERDQLLHMQRRTHDMAWQCNQGRQDRCDDVVDNVRYINDHINTGYNYDRRGDWRRRW